MQTIVNAPQKVTVTPLALAGDVGRWTGMPDVKAVFLTEVAAADRAAVLASAAGDGWTVSRKQGHGADVGLGECAILTRDDFYTVKSVHWFKVWDGGGKGRLAHAIYAIAVVATTPTGHVVILTGLHTPAHVEGIWSRIPMPERFRARHLANLAASNHPRVLTYLQVLRRWRNQVQHLAGLEHADDVIAAPDGNLDAHKPWVAKLLGRAWPGMNLAVTKGNDLGHRAVGWVLTTFDLVASHVEKAKASDHDAAVYQLRHVNKTPAKQRPAKTAPAPDPFERCTYNGALLDQKTKAFIQMMEHQLGYALTILQGCYNPGGVAKSAGTHDGGGVFDLAPFDWQNKEHVGRLLGGFVWHRPFNWDGQDGGEHIHCGIRNQGKLAPAAADQQRQYDADPGTNGLANHGIDPDPFHPSPPVGFDYQAAWRELQAAA